MTPSQLRQFLAETPPFACADPSVRALIESEIDTQIIRGGEVLFHQGDPGDRLYVVASGRLRVTVPHEEGHEDVLGEVGCGQSVGEMALIAGGTRSATVRAIRDTELVSLSKQAYERVMMAHPQALLHLTRTITQRYLGRIHNSPQCERIATLAVVPSTGDIASSTIAAQLATTAGQAANVAHIKEADLNGDTDRIRDLERRFDLVILDTGDPASPWARHCVNAADRVLLIADGSTAPAADQPWRRLHDELATSSTARWDLALQWPGDTPHDTARWLASGSFTQWHHLRHENAQDLARLTRWILGHAIGLVLSGGGARAFVHIGVLRALREANIPVDAIGGTSMGAIVAALFATGMDDARLTLAMQKSIVKGKPLADVTIPAVSLVAGRRISRILHRALGETCIEDLPLPMFAISSNLTRACAVEHRHGTLWRALRASIAIPGILSPSILNDEILVDGGIIDNLPVRPMLNMGVGQVIAVDAAADHDMKVGLTDRDSYLARDLLRHNRGRAGGATGHLPGILDILLRAVALSSAAAPRPLRPDVDLLLNPPTGDLGLLDWKGLDRAVACGYEHAAPLIADWRALNMTTSGRAAA